MKILKIVCAVFAVLWTAGCFFELFFNVMPRNGGPINVSQALGSLVGMVLGAAFSVALFQSALTKSVETNTPQHEAPQSNDAQPP